MKTPPAALKVQELVHVGDCLYRSSVTDIYYGIFKREGRQVKRSLKTTDRELAKRKLEELRRKVDRLTGDDAKTLPFTEYRRDEKTGQVTDDLIGGLAKRWLDAAAVSLKPKTVGMYRNSIKMLAKHFGSMTVRSITLREIEQWAAKRSGEVSGRTFNVDLEVLRRILDYACRHGLMLDNPAKEIKRRQLSREKIVIPTKDEFRKLLEAMRANNGKDSADLVEFLGYGGCRLGEVVGDAAHGKAPLTWGDVNFKLKTFTVTGKGRGEAGKTRTVPLFPPLERLLLTFRARMAHEPGSAEPIFGIGSAMTSIGHACAKLKLPKYHHHTMRHFFCSNCIEAGVDFKVIAGWLGHVDGGILVARTYGHLRDQHSALMARRITFDASHVYRLSGVMPWI
jgi:site-specific recombinase XerD